MDQFAQIAANGIGGNAALLEPVTPIPHETVICRLEQADAQPIAVKPHLSTTEELKTELAAMREAYRPFLENHAPAFESLRRRMDLTSFLRDGQPVTIPEYGGPIGVCKKTYETTFELPALLAGQSVYIHFDGADYRAVVTVNDTFGGEHEGFFSPFEFEITGIVKDGTNRLKVELYNDHIYMGNDPGGSEETEGDKLYAATGLGWDGPLDGWHHCPSGMGIYNRVYVEIRNSVHISDLYIRPLDGKAEAWLEIQNDSYDTIPVELSLSLYGQNFQETVFEDRRYTPETTRFVGMGDSLTEAAVKSELGKGIPMPLKHGKNLYKLKFDLPNAKLWDLETPYLYQLHAAVLVNGAYADRLAQQFGMRSFTQDTESPQRKGMFYLNGRSIRLRGANTMGFEQQDVLRGDLPQLIDDILLAKLCNMNFLRLTQRPVQDEVYEYCDKLGLMTQTDLPLFGVMRRFRVPEGIRQAEELARMVRKHPCNVVVSYINEPFPNDNNEPHAHLIRP